MNDVSNDKGVGRIATLVIGGLAIAIVVWFIGGLALSIGEISFGIIAVAVLAMAVADYLLSVINPDRD